MVSGKSALFISHVFERKRGQCRPGTDYKRCRERSSVKEHREDALAPDAEEGRGKLRKATGSRKQALNRRYPNGETRRGSCPVTHR